MAKTTTMKLERSACGKFFRFNAIIRCSYVADMREKLVTEWVAVPKGNAAFLAAVEREEDKVAARQQEMDSQWLADNACGVRTLDELHSIVADCVVMRRAGGTNVLVFKQSHCDRHYPLTTLRDARCAVAEITLLLEEKLDFNPITALLPHYVRQRAFELLEAKQFLSARRVFDV